MGTLSILVIPEGREVWRSIRKTAVTPQDGGTVTTLFTVTGDVMVQIFGVCKTALTSGGAITVAVGISGDTGFIITQITDAKDLIANEVWTDATPTKSIENVPAKVAHGIIISNSQDVILTPSGTFTAGSIDFYCTWKPMSVNGNMV